MRIGWAPSRPRVALLRKLPGLELDTCHGRPAQLAVGDQDTLVVTLGHPARQDCSGPGAGLAYSWTFFVTTKQWQKK